MINIICLEGGAEFGGQMAAADGETIASAGGLDIPVRIIPTAAAPDSNHQRAGGNGIRVRVKTSINLAKGDCIGHTLVFGLRYRTSALPSTWVFAYYGPLVLY